jgi:HemY protein
LQSATDVRQLEQAWRSLEEPERAMPEVAVHAASRLLELGGETSGVRQWLAPVWDHLAATSWAGLSEDLRVRLVLVLERGLDSIDSAWLARLEAALQLQPRDPYLQYLAGMACLHRQLWGKAQQLLGQAVTQLADANLLRRAWRALARLAEQRGDSASAEQAYRKLSEL